MQIHALLNEMQRIGDDLVLLPLCSVFVVSIDDDLVLVRQRGQPLVKVRSISQLAKARKVTGMNQNVAVWNRQLAVLAVGVGDALQCVCV